MLYAGLAAYPSWVPSLQILTRKDAPPSIFTDFCEVSQGRMQYLPISVNPFRKPLSCQSRDNNLPSYSNAFVFGMAPMSEFESYQQSD